MQRPCGKRAGQTMAITYLIYLKDFFFFRSVFGFSAAENGCFFHIAVGSPTGYRLKS